jgi:hypothetical protein
MPWDQDSPLAVGVGTAAGYLKGQQAKKEQEYQRQQDLIKNAIAQTAAQGESALRTAEGSYYGAKATAEPALAASQVGLNKAKATSLVDAAATNRLRAISQSQHWQRMDKTAQAKVAATIKGIQEKWNAAVLAGTVNEHDAAVKADAEIQAAWAHASGEEGAAQIRASAEFDPKTIGLKAYYDNYWKAHFNQNPPKLPNDAHQFLTSRAIRALPPDLQAKLAHALSQPKQSVDSVMGYVAGVASGSVKSNNLTPDEANAIMQAAATATSPSTP